MTVLPVVLSVGSSASQLDRRQGVVSPGGFAPVLGDDADVRDLLRTRGGTEDSLSAAVSATATTITLSSGSAAYADGATVYLDRETVTLGTHTGSGTYTGCTRGAEDSDAAPHAASAVTSSVPRHWRDRVVELEAVNLATGSSTTVAVGKLASSPRFANGQWTLDVVGLEAETTRRVCDGWEPQRPTSLSFSGEVVTVNVPDATAFSDEADGFVRVDYREGFEVYELAAADVDHGAGTIAIDLSTMVHRSESAGAGLASDDVDCEIRQVHLLRGDPALLALSIMLSSLGDGATSATYDTLPGVSPSTVAGDAGAPFRRMGAGLPLSLVDVDAWEALEGVAGPMVLLLEEPQRLLDLLTNEFAWRLGGYVYATPAGKISFRRYEVATPGATIDILGDADFGGPGSSAIDDEAEIIGGIELESDWSHERRQHERRTVLQWQDVRPIYGDAVQRIRLSSRSLRLSPGGSAIDDNASSATSLVVAFDRMYSRVRRGVRRLRALLPWKWHVDARPGWVFEASDSYTPDLEGGMGFSGRRLEATGVRVDADSGSVVVDCEEIPRGFVVAPAAYVASVSDPTITLDTTGTEAELFDSDPGQDFAVGFDVRIFDASASPPFSVSEVERVDAVAASTLTLESLPSSFTVAAGDLVVLEHRAIATAAAANTGAASADHLGMVDASGELVGGAIASTSWE